MRFEAQPTPRWGLFAGAAAALPVVAPSFSIVEEQERRRVYHAVEQRGMETAADLAEALIRKMGEGGPISVADYMEAANGF